MLADASEQKREEPESGEAFEQRQLASHASMVEDGGASAGDVQAMVAEVVGQQLSVAAQGGQRFPLGRVTSVVAAEE